MQDMNISQADKQSEHITLLNVIFLIRLEIHMETNPYEYDRTESWTPQQNELYQNTPVEAHHKQFLQSQNQQLPQRSVGQKSGTPVKMPKARALAMANALKRAL